MIRILVIVIILLLTSCAIENQSSFLKYNRGFYVVSKDTNTKKQDNSITRNNDYKKSSAQNYTSKWITPTTDYVTWTKAKELCLASGGRLPTIEELKKIVINCGGEMNGHLGDYNYYTYRKAELKRNINNTSYQSCYKQKGFYSGQYWSSTLKYDVSPYAWCLNFYYGHDNWNNNDLTNTNHIRCIKKGE